MREVDPGHIFQLYSLDTPSSAGYGDYLTFVKREGKGFPGNIGHFPGTTTQEVLRAIISRAKYVNNQEPHPANTVVISSARNSLLVLEGRAAARHNRKLKFEELASIENEPICSKCGHIGHLCEGAVYVRHQ